MPNPKAPYTEHILEHTGFPVSFVVGPAQKRFDVHNTLLAQLSVLFQGRDAPLNPLQPILLPTIDPIDFRHLFDWIYKNRAPSHFKEFDLERLVRLWLTAGKLGISAYQNACLRLIMALMQPKRFVLDIEIVRHVYENTQKGSKFRAFIIAVFCQRTGPVKPHFFSSPVYARLGILQDAVAFLRTLEIVRKGNPTGIKSYQLGKMGGAKLLEMNPGRSLTVAHQGGKMSVDWNRVRWPLPYHLVFGELWEPLPDKFFVSAGESADMAVEVKAQLAQPGMWQKEGTGR